MQYKFFIYMYTFNITLPFICKTVAVVQWHSKLLYILRVMRSLPSASILGMILHRNLSDKSRTQYNKFKNIITRELLLTG